MKTIAYLGMSIFLAFAGPAHAQNKLVIIDEIGLINEATETVLMSRFAEDTIELTSIVDMRRRCEYWQATLSTQNSILSVTVTDCNNVVAGKKNIGAKIFQANDQEKALLIYYALTDIFANPNPEEHAAIDEKEAGEDVDMKTAVRLPDPEQHRSRYFFAPSSYNIGKGDLYYNTLYFFLHDVQYGISKQFSMGMGTTLAGLPFYLTPKLTFPIDSTSSFAIGDLLMLGTWGTSFFGNLLYGTYSRGGAYNNFTIGGGYLYTSNGDLTQQTNAPVFNFSFLLHVSDHIYFLSENYVSQLKSKQTASYSSYNPISDEYSSYDESFRQNVFFIYGMAGFRFINRKNDIVSWQFGLTYLFRSLEDIPSKYNNSNWNTSDKSGNRFIAFPAIGYARRFATKY